MQATKKAKDDAPQQDPVVIDTTRALIDLYKEQFGDMWQDYYQKTVTISVPSNHSTRL
jgi:hypothetical protein